MQVEEKILIHSILKQLEWSKWVESHQICPICHEAFKYGHTPDCMLKKSLEILLAAEE